MVMLWGLMADLHLALSRWHLKRGERCADQAAAEDVSALLRPSALPVVLALLWIAMVIAFVWWRA